MDRVLAYRGCGARVAVVAVIVVLALTPAAIAAAPRQEDHSAPTTTRTERNGLLPFTDQDLGFLVVAGGTLLLLGDGLRRLSSRRPRRGG